MPGDRGCLVDVGRVRVVPLGAAVAALSDLDDGFVLIGSWVDPSAHWNLLLHLAVHEQLARDANERTATCNTTDCDQVWPCVVEQRQAAGL